MQNALSQHGNQQPHNGKKTLFPDFNIGSAITDQIPLLPHEFATRKIKAAEYVDLWYFTTEGLKEASMATLAANDDTFGLLKTEAGLAFQQIHATKASRNAITDEHLSWDQIMTARLNIIAAVTTHGWPPKYTMTLAKFYINLEGLKATGTNPRTLIHYHAIARKTWHAALKGQGTPFDLSIVNTTLLGQIENQINQHDFQEMKKQASSLTKLENKYLLTPPSTLSLPWPLAATTISSTQRYTLMTPQPQPSLQRLADG